jgi:hypothetical protein
VNHDDLTIDDGLAANVQSGGDGREAFGPVQPVTGVDLLSTGVGVNLDAIAVIFNFVNPLLTPGSLA